MNRRIHCTLEGIIAKDKELDLVVRILEDEEIAGHWEKEGQVREAWSAQEREIRRMCIMKLLTSKHLRS